MVQIKQKAQEQIEYICAQLAVLAEKSQKKNIVFASTVDSKNLAGIDEIADKAIGKTLSDAKYAGAVLTDAKALKVLEAAEGVVLIEKLFATTYNDFEKVNTVREYDAPEVDSPDGWTISSEVWSSSNESVAKR